MKFNLFNSTAPGKSFKSTNFDLSHEVKLTTDIGKLTPVLMEPVLPGDKWKGHSEIFIRFASLLAPIMHQVDCYMHFFFVPMRLAYKDTETFFTGGVDGTEQPVYPRVRLTPLIYESLGVEKAWKLFGPGSVADYLGFPPICMPDGKAKDRIFAPIEYDLIPFVSLYLTWYRFYRDQNSDYGVCLQTENLPTEEEIKELVKGVESGVVDFDSSPIYELLFTHKFRAWEKDYFTSALPWAQRGPELMIPGIGQNSVDVSDLRIGADSAGNNDVYFRINSPNLVDGANQYSFGGKTATNSQGVNVSLYGPGNIANGAPGDILPANFEALEGTAEFDMRRIAENLVIEGGASSGSVDAGDGTINNLRRMLQIQRYTEAEARGGSRFTEWLQQIWGTSPGDYRLQNPIYIGGGKTKVVISEVLQQSATATTPDGSDSPLGEFAGRAVTAGSSRRFNCRFKEYGYIIGLLSIKPRSSYMQGFPRKYTKIDKFDFGNPYFAHLGEQEVKNKELFFEFSNGNKNEETFGYQSRYAEYKFLPNRTCGDMRTQFDFWHLTRKFDGLPGLNNQFIYINPREQTRIFAVEEQFVAVDSSKAEDVITVPLDHLFCQVYFQITAKRKLPKYGIPS